MLKSVLICLAWLTSIAAFAQNPRWTEFGTHIPANTNLNVRWNTPTNFGVGSNLPTNAWPKSIGIYRLQPRNFSGSTISNLLTICGLNSIDKVGSNASEVVYRSGAKILSVSAQRGTVEYRSPEPLYGPTNLAKGVPSLEEMPEQAKTFLRALEVPLSEIARNSNGLPSFRVWQPFTEFYVGKSSITNIAFRGVVFGRAVENVNVVGDAGRCRLEIGEMGKICKIDFGWPELTLESKQKVFAPKQIVAALRKGLAIQGLLPTGFGEIDWLRVKSIKINQAWPAFFAGESNHLYPFMTLWVNVETDHGEIDLEIDCPIFDENSAGD